jgi:hypothetical protein
MKRREFIKLFGGAVATWPFSARAQQAGYSTVGLLSSASPEARALGITVHSRCSVAPKDSHAGYTRCDFLKTPDLYRPVHFALRALLLDDIPCRRSARMKLLRPGCSALGCMLIAFRLIAAQ